MDKIIKVVFNLAPSAPVSLKPVEYLVGPVKGVLNYDYAKSIAFMQLYRDVKARAKSYGDEKYGLLKYYKDAELSEEVVL